MDQRFVKKCRVCGDKALSFNFNGLCCESCKIFFRRNALKYDEFKCYHGGNCPMDIVTRKTCQRCRLDKCFSIGMRKELIVTKNSGKTGGGDSSSSVIASTSGTSGGSGGSQSSSSAVPLSALAGKNMQLCELLQAPLDDAMMVDDGDNDDDENHHNDDGIRLMMMVTESSSKSSSSDPRSSGSSNLVRQSQSLAGPSTSSFSAAGASKRKSHKRRLKEEKSITGGRKSKHKRSPDHHSTDESETKDEFENDEDDNDDEEDEDDDIEVGEPLNEQTHRSAAHTAAAMLLRPYESHCLEVIRKVTLLFHDSVPTIVTAPDRPPVQIAGYATDLMSIFNNQEAHIQHMLAFTNSIRGFQQLAQPDQLVMFKAAFPEILLLRSAFFFNFEKNAFLARVSQEYALYVKLDMLYFGPSREDTIRLHRKLAYKVNEEMDQDTVIRDLVSVLLMFKPKDEVTCPEYIRYQYFSYCHLLRKYLQFKYQNNRKATEKYFKLQQIVTDVGTIVRSALNVVSRNVDSSKVSDVLTEIYYPEKQPDSADQSPSDQNKGGPPPPPPPSSDSSSGSSASSSPHSSSYGSASNSTTSHTNSGPSHHRSQQSNPSTSRTNTSPSPSSSSSPPMAMQHSSTTATTTTSSPPLSHSHHAYLHYQPYQSVSSSSPPSASYHSMVFS